MCTVSRDVGNPIVSPGACTSARRDRRSQHRYHIISDNIRHSLNKNPTPTPSQHLRQRASQSIRSMPGRLPRILADSHFPLHNRPYGVFSVPYSASPGDRSHGSSNATHRCIGVALGDSVIDLGVLHARGFFSSSAVLQDSQCFQKVTPKPHSLNDL